MSDSKFTYEVLEENENPYEVKIVKKNVEVEFTMGELYEHESRVDKIIRELDGKRQMEEASLENVEHFHPDAVAAVKDLEPEAQHAAFTWLKSKATLAEIEPKLKEITEAFEAHNEEVKDIIAQTGWVAPDVAIVKNGQEDTESDKE